MFAEICQKKDIAAALYDELLIVILMMHGRTRLSAERNSAAEGAVVKEGFRRVQLAKGKTLPDSFSRMRIREKSTALRSVRRSILAFPLVLDLDLRLIVAPKGRWFVTSDHPVVILNQAFFDLVPNSFISGIAMTGIQFFLPLSPELLLLAFDKDIYRVGKPGRRVYHLERGEDCDLINALQIMNAEQNVYFYSEEDEQLVRQLLVRFFKERERAHESAKPVEFPAEGDEPSWIVTQTPRMPIPGKWSFCKVRRTPTQKDFGKRDPERYALFERYSKDTAKSPKPFATWLNEQAMKEENFA